MYIIGNLINWKVYVGQTKNPRKRKTGHFCKARTSNDARPLYRSIRKYGEENFLFNVIEECDDDLIDEREKYWIVHFDSINPDRGYNLTPGGDSNPMKDPLIRAKVGRAVSLALKGRQRSEHEKKRISEGRKGIKFSSEWRSNISRSLFGRKRNVKPVMQLREGSVLQTFESIKAAATMLRLDSTKISHAAKISSTYAGFDWRFVNGE